MTNRYVLKDSYMTYNTPHNEGKPFQFSGMNINQSNRKCCQLIQKVLNNIIYIEEEKKPLSMIHI